MSWKLATFNVNGIRARLPIILQWLQERQPDAVCLQELKCQDKDFPASALEEIGYRAAYRGQKSFNGVAILSKSEPEAVLKSFEDGGEDEEARLIAAQFDDLWVVNTYVPQGRDPEDPAFQYKLEFFRRLKAWFDQHFDPVQPVLWTGDINVAPEPIDVFDPERMEGQIGFHPEERATYADVLSWGLTDLFRKHHPERKQFTFWDYRLPNGFKRNLGWRIDHILVTESLADRSLDCDVDVAPRSLPKPSDHTPVWAEFNLVN